MLKLPLIMEDVAEKLLNWFLPQVEAQASCWLWEYRYIADSFCCNGRFSTRVEKRQYNPCGGYYGPWMYVHHRCDRQKCYIA